MKSRLSSVVSRVLMVDMVRVFSSFWLIVCRCGVDRLGGKNLLV